MESLADAGLPELVAGRATFTAADDPLEAELLQADIARTASRSRRWSDAAKIMDGLHGVPALLLRRRHTTGAPGSVSVHLRPPDGLAIKNRAFPPAMVTTVEALTSTAAGVAVDVTDSDLDALVDHVLPGPLLADLQSGAVHRLVVVPDDDLWHVPWAHATALRKTDVRLLPSLSQRARVGRHPTRRSSTSWPSWTTTLPARRPWSTRSTRPAPVAVSG